MDVAGACAWSRVKLLLGETPRTKPRPRRPHGTLRAHPFTETTCSGPSLSATWVSRISVTRGQRRSENVEGRNSRNERFVALNRELPRAA